MSERRSLSKEISRYAISIIILGVGVGGLILLSQLKKTPASAEVPDKTVFVETTPIVLHLDDLQLRAYGVVVPYREIIVSAEVAGKITFKHDSCRAGRFVEMGNVEEDKLIEIDPNDYQFEVNRLTEEQNRAIAAIEEWKTDAAGVGKLLALATRQFNSQRAEYERQTRVSGVLSANDLERAERALLAAENAMMLFDNRKNLLAAGESRLLAAKKLVDVQLARARNDLSRTKILAPVTGVIVSDDVEQGQFVQKGTPLFTIEDTSQVEVKCNLTKEDLKWIWLTESPAIDGPLANNYQIPKLKVTVSYDFNKVRYSWQGELDRFDGIGIDSKTRTIPCRVIVKHPRKVNVANKPPLSPAAPRALIRNMYVTVLIHARPRLRLWKVPCRAVRPGNVVWVVRGGMLKNIPIEVAQQPSVQQGARNNERRLLASQAEQPDNDQHMIVHSPNDELTAGDRVITSPLSYPSDGLQVQEKTAP